MSAAQTPAASEATAPGAVPVADAETVVGAESAAPAESVPDTEVRAKPGPIVLVLPLASESFRARPRPCARDFSPRPTRPRSSRSSSSTATRDVLAAFAKAKAAGAQVIVGPLVRDDMKTLAAAGADLPPTIALNQLDEGAPLPRNVYILTLTIDGEARQLARLARDDGRGEGRRDRQRHAAAAALRERLQRRMDTRRRRRRR